MRNITTVILDWAGTAVDYGSFAPVEAFQTAFAAFGLAPTLGETRAPMGMQKRAHIAQMLRGERLAAAWQTAQGRPHTEEDIDHIYAAFEPALFAVLPQFAEPLPGVLDVMAALRARGIRIGSTTGYTKAMMEVVAPLAAANGYAPDCLVCPDDVGGTGRPAPYMLWRNLELLRVGSIHEVLKIGDTAADMQEAKNAGCRCVGVLVGSSMVGLSAEELAALNGDAREALFARAKEQYFAAGADDVIPDIASLPAFLRSLA
ncbi:MAG: phosphonoacetaldehyde hydrolase [Oscillospiraceae bacterium]|jgi:phosphonoacetaldehyde hydrolase|nr:phosphonoacetaldehyde hydrolase [Oscillospiraceae bacterium]